MNRRTDILPAEHTHHLRLALNGSAFLNAEANLTRAALDNSVAEPAALADQSRAMSSCGTTGFVDRRHARSREHS